MSPTKPASNWTLLHSSTFFLIGIPGLQYAHLWISIPFCAIYILACLGNSLLLVVVKREQSLHEPMYLFLCMLAVADLVVINAIVPQNLGIFWFGRGNIHINGCLLQLFVIHAISESGLILAMAFDRYVAICKPLRHSALLTQGVVAKIGIAILLRGAVLLTPHPFMLRWLPYCKSHVISHTYCEFMALVKLACADTTAQRAYSLTLAFMTGGLDLVLIIVSYILIFHAVFQLPTKEARLKSLGTCGSHACVILVFYVPAFFTYLSHRFGHVAPYIHILVANLYFLFPPLMNPIIYGVRTKRIQQGLLKLLGPKGA